MNTRSQPAILLPVPSAARYLEFRLLPETTLTASRKAIQSIRIDESCLVGIGAPLVSHWGKTLEGLRVFPALSGPGVQIPSTQPALWCWLRGEDRGELLLRGKEITRDLSEAFHLDGIIEGFKFGGADLGRDLTGYEDGTENPVGNAAADAAIVKNGEPGMGGSSFAAVQLWKHDLETFSSMPQQQQDLIIGRRKSDNEEIDDAPESAHVKRTAQESFNPEAFLLRRSMPWADGSGEGLMFVAFGCSVDAFEAQLTRMAGLEDTIVDAIFRFSVPVTGSYYWCPPMRDDHLDLSALQD